MRYNNGKRERLTVLFNFIRPRYSPFSEFKFLRTNQDNDEKCEEIWAGKNLRIWILWGYVKHFNKK